MDALTEASATSRIRKALLATGISNFTLVRRANGHEPSGLCVQFSFVEGHVYPDDARRLLSSLVRSTLPEVEVYNSRTWSDGDRRIVCICTCPRVGAGELILMEELDPVQATVRQILYEAGLLSSPNVLTSEWPTYKTDRYGRFGYRLCVDVVRPTYEYPFPRDVLLTIAYEPQGPRDDQERRVSPLLSSIREALVETGRFRYVLTAGNSLSSNGDSDEAVHRRCQLGFNVTDVELLRQQRIWETT